MLSFRRGSAESKAARSPSIPRAFIGRPSPDAATAVAEHAATSVAPMSDHSASADYRIALTKVLVERTFIEALSHAAQRRGRLQ